MAQDKIYIGSGIEKFEGNLIEVSLCISDIPKEWIFEYQGKKYLKIKVQKKREPDQYGKTHSVEINTFKPEPKTNVQKYAESQKKPMSEQIVNAPDDNPADDLPF
jgi:hypothetical protein